MNKNSYAGIISPPSLILKSIAKGGNRENKMGEMTQLLFFFKKKKTCKRCCNKQPRFYVALSSAIIQPR